MKKIYFLLFSFMLFAKANAQDGALDLTYITGTGANGTIIASAIQPDGKVLVGGAFTAYDGITRNRIARINMNGTLDATFNPGTGADANVNTISIQSDGKIIIGGYFTSFDGNTVGHIARLNTNGTIDLTFAPTTGTTGGGFAVLCSVIQPSDGKILIGGGFNLYNGVSRKGIARINTDGSNDASFTPGTGSGGSSVNSIALQPSNGKIVIGGFFTLYNGVSRNKIARVNTDGTLDVSFTPGTGANGTVGALLIQPTDEKIVIGGSFTTYAGTSRTRLARVNTDGTLDTGFDPGTGANNTVSSILFRASDNKIMFAGNFTLYNGFTSNRIARVLPDGTFDASFNPNSGADASINTMSMQSNYYFVIGGDYTTYDGTARTRLSRIVGGFPLPVELRELNGKTLASSNLLQWSTNSESNNEGFEVEASNDGIHFEKIGFVQGAGSSQTLIKYQFEDLNPQYNKEYYRLKQLDIDGHFVYSNIVLLENKIDVVITAFPNPTSNSITVRSPNDFKKATIQVVNLQGSIIYTKENVEGTACSIDLSHQSNGIYFVQVIQNGSIQKIKITKTN